MNLLNGTAFRNSHKRNWLRLVIQGHFVNMTGPSEIHISNIIFVIDNLNVNLIYLSKDVSAFYLQGIL
ncbi:hypothetical protein D3C73_1397950 [compost metagenome]